MPQHTRHEEVTRSSRCALERDLRPRDFYRDEFLDEVTVLNAFGLFGFHWAFWVVCYGCILLD
jgi:hypothetical protein